MLRQNPIHQKLLLGHNEVDVSPSQDEASAKKGYNNFRWTPSMSRFLMKFLAKAKLRLKVDKTFKRHVFVAAVRAVNKKFKVKCSESNVENHIRTIKKHYAQIKRLRGLNGVVFNETEKKIVMDDKDYSAHVEAHPEDEPYLNKSIQFYDEMAIICGDEQAIGSIGKGTAQNIMEGIETNGNDLDIQKEEDIEIEDSGEETQFKTPRVSTSSGSAEITKQSCKRSSGFEEMVDNVASQPEMDISQQPDEAAAKKGYNNFRWAPMMSRFLILFLAKAKLRMKVDKIFKRQVLEAAARAVSKKFKVKCYESNVENHIRTIKKHYAQIKRLRAFNSVFFNETEKKIVMDDDTYIEHIQAHPEDEPYLNKSIEFYNEMAIICGDEQAIGSFAMGTIQNIAEGIEITDYDLDIQRDEDIEFGEIGEESLSKSPQGSTSSGSTEIAKLSGKRIHGLEEMIEIDIFQSQDEPTAKRPNNFLWTTAMSRFLISFLAEQAKMGLKIGKVFRREAFVATARAVSGQFKVKCTEANVENHMKTIKKQYAQIKRLRALSGVIFDETEQKIVMDVDAYTKYIQEHPKDEPFLNKSIELYDEMTTICGEDQATGSFARGIIENIADSIETTGDNLDTQSDDEMEIEQIGEETQSKTPPVSTPSGSRGRAKRSGKRSRVLEKMIGNVALQIGEVAAAIKSIRKDISSELFSEIMKCEGYDETSLGKAFDYLYEHDNLARAFLAKNKNLRQAWLSDFLSAPITSVSFTPVISLTDKALNHLYKMRSERNEDLCLRVGVKQGGCSGISYTMEFENRANARLGDSIIEHNGFVLVCDPRSCPFLHGMQLDFSDALIGGGFSFKNPNANQTCGCGKSFAAKI